MSQPTAVRRPGLPVGAYLAAAAVLVLLVATASRYGFHRDELYFIEAGRHPAWGHPDNPILVPLLAAGWHQIVGGRLWAFRILPALAAAGFVLVAGLIAAELGGSRRHQVAASAATALTALVLAAGHLFSTLAFDLVLSATALWLLIRSVRDNRWVNWLLLGVVTGLASEVKILALLVIGCCLLGLVIIGPRRPLANRRLWAAAAIAVTIAAPNLIWQAVHGWPQTAIAANIAAGGSASSADRMALLPLHLLMIGPIVCVIAIIGLVRLLRRPLRGEVGWVAVGYLAFLIFTLISGGKPYYPAAFFPVLLAVGAIAVLDWTWPRVGRRVLVASALTVSVIVTPLLMLPLAPIGSPLFHTAMAVNSDAGETVGWDGHVRTVRAVADQIPAEQRRHTVIITDNYGEAGALARARRSAEPATLPPVYSGHNAFGAWGPPPESTRMVIMVGDFDPGDLGSWFSDCREVTRLRSPAGLDNEEQGAPVRICTGPQDSWSGLWPRIRHLS